MASVKIMTDSKIQLSMCRFTWTPLQIWS